MTSTLIHYISLPRPPASPPSHHPPALSTRLILSISLPSVCHSKFLPHRSIPPFHFTSVLFLYSFFPAFFFPLIINALLMIFSISLNFHSFVALFFLPFPLPFFAYLPFSFSLSRSSLLLSSLSEIQSEHQNGEGKGI